MALPEITLPSNLPAFLAAGHGFEPESAYADTPMRTGHARRRRVYTAAPRVQAVSLFLTVEQMAAFDAWFEVALLAGERMFSALVADEQGWRSWWAARWVEPYSAEPIPGRYWRVTGRLLLTGEPSLTPPVNTGMASESAVALVGSAALTVQTMLASESTVALQGVVGETLLASETVIALTGNVGATGHRLREDGGLRLREDGGKRLRE